MPKHHSRRSDIAWQPIETAPKEDGQQILVGHWYRRRWYSYVVQWSYGSKRWGGLGGIPSDRTPSYATSTLDIEALHNGKWREMASCSIRTDFADDMLVCEIAVGLDRVATLAESA